MLPVSLKHALLCWMLWAICCVSASAAQLVSVSLSENVSEEFLPINVTTRFFTDTPAIHGIVVLEQAQVGMKVNSAWVAVDAIDVPNYRIDEAEVAVPDPSSRLHFSITRPNNGWPVGNYRFEVYFGDSLVSTAPFQVESRQIEQSPGMPFQQSQGLQGLWQCSNGYIYTELNFVSSSQLLFDGEPARYRLLPGMIVVEDGYGRYQYPYRLQGGSLMITFPEGATLQCQRQGGIGAPPAPPNMNQGWGAPPAQGMDGGMAYQLSGMLCSWSGSSGYSSSYSSATRVYFDGRGSFQYSSESSFSGDAGMAYGGSPGANGRYQVMGDQVLLQFSDGSQGYAQVHMRQNDGRITELMYEGTLYASGLCD